MLIIFFLIIVLVEDNLSRNQDELGFSEDIVKGLKGLGLDKQIL